MRARILSTAAISFGSGLAAWATRNGAASTMAATAVARHAVIRSFMKLRGFQFKLAWLPSLQPEGCGCRDLGSLYAAFRLKPEATLSQTICVRPGIASPGTSCFPAHSTGLGTRLTWELSA